MRKVLVPGSYDPVHNGHMEIIERASKLFDEVIVAAVLNPNKNEALFTLEERREMLEESTAYLGNVSIEFFTGLLVDRRICQVAIPRHHIASGAFDLVGKLACDRDADIGVLRTQTPHPIDAAALLHQLDLGPGELQ